MTGRHILLGVAMLAVTAADAGCATLINGTTQKVSFSSDPPGATVTVDRKNIGTTPVTVSLTRHDNHAVRIEKTGYIPYEVTTVSVGSSNWMAFEMLFPPAGLFLWPVDHYYGGDCKIEPEEVSAHLVAAAPAALAGARQ